MRLVEFWALNPNGTLRAPLPDITSWAISPVANDAGAAEIVYPINGTNYNILRETITYNRHLAVQVRIDGTIHPELQILIRASQGDDISENNPNRTFTGVLPAGRLKEAVVEPKSGMDAQGNDSTIEQDGHYYSCTMGTIVSTLMTEAQVRGALNDFTFASFTGTHDSNGVAWSQIITLKMTPGTDYLKVLQALVEAGLGEFRVIGTDLRLYEPNTIGVDRTLTNPPLILRTGNSITDSPRKHTVENVATAALVAGAQGVYQWASDPDALTRLGRRIETFTSQGSISDPGTLTAYSQHFLDGVTPGRMEKNHGMVIVDDTTPAPVDDFDIGDWCWSDLGAGLERLRIPQWTLVGNDDGTITAGVTLNDLIAEREAAQAKRLEGIAGGTTISGTSTARQIPDSYIDGEPPEPPDSAGITVSSLAYITDEGTTLAAVSVQWDPILFNQNGTALTDLARYVVRWRYADPDMSPISLLLSWSTLTGTSDDTFANFSAVRPGVWIDVQVGGVDVAGNFSGWSATVAHLTANDTNAPPTPPAPVATAFIGTIKWEWNGLGALGETMPSDFSHAEFHVSTVNNFTESAATLYDTLAGPGAVAQTNAAYGTTYYGRLVLVDTSGNKSTHSAIASTQARQILNPDVANLSIGSAQIIDLDVGKVTAGTISSPWIIGSSVQTSTSGARFGFNASEFFAWNAGGTKTVSITNAGAVSILGEIKTAVSGARVVVNPGGTAPTEIRFYPANASLAKYISLFTTDVPGWPGYSLVYLKGDRYTGLSGEAVLRMWWYEASFGWFDSTADILSSEESAVYAQQYSAGMNSSRLQFIAHGLRDTPTHDFAWTTDSGTMGIGMGSMKKDSLDAFVIGCPAKGTAFAFQAGTIYAVSWGNTLVHANFTAATVTQSSGVATKTNIENIDDLDVLAILEAAPTKRWEYRRDHEQPADPTTFRTRKPGHLKKGDTIDVEVTIPAPPTRPIHKHYGPMAEDLPAGVVIPDTIDPTSPLIDHGSLMGLQWEILRRLHAKIRNLETQLTNPRGKP